MADLESRKEIEQRVDRLLRQAGARFRFPTPIEDIVAAQQLQLSKSATSPLAIAILSTAPQALKEKLRGFRFNLLAMLDRPERFIHVDPNDLEVRRRFSTCHEVGHDLCSWQSELYYLDGPEQLKPQIHDLFEREANYAGAELLFQREVFCQVARGYQPGAATIKVMAAYFGASIHATFRQYVTTSSELLLGFVLSHQPWRETPTTYQFAVRDTFASERFTAAFPLLDLPPRWLATQNYPDLASAWDQLQNTSSSSEGYLQIPSRTGEDYLLRFELFSNSYHLFLLAFKPEQKRLRVVMK